MKIAEWLKMTTDIDKDSGFNKCRPRIYCNDGFSMSVQADKVMYCIPRNTLESGEYKACEIGFPSIKEELIMEYAESADDPTETVYCYVPVELIDKVIEKHGGIKLDKNILAGMGKYD